MFLRYFFFQIKIKNFWSSLEAALVVSGFPHFYFKYFFDEKLTSQQTHIFQDIKEVSSKIMSSLRKTRANDSDSVVRLHADLALLEIETLLNDTFSSSLDKNTHIVK